MGDGGKQAGGETLQFGDKWSDGMFFLNVLTTFLPPCPCERRVTWDTAHVTPVGGAWGTPIAGMSDSPNCC